MSFPLHPGGTGAIIGADDWNAAANFVNAYGDGFLHFHTIGGSPSNTGTQNSTALTNAINDLIARGGGVLQFDAQRYVFDPVSLPSNIGGMIWLVGVNRGTRFTTSNTSSTRVWMMTFGSGGDDIVNQYSFANLWIEPPTFGTRSTFNGIWVHATNEMRVLDCQARNVDGMAWRFDRPHNSKIDVRTVNCGSSADALHSVLICGTLANFGAAVDAVWNDSIITGMSEADYLGWRIENGLGIRPGSTLKITGSSNSTKSLHLHRILSGRLSVLATQTFLGANFIRITDGGSADTSIVPITVASLLTKMSLNVIGNFNCTAGDVSGNQALIGIDCRSTGSHVEVDGFLQTMATAGAVAYFVHLPSPGGNVTVDLTGLKTFDPTPAQHILDQRTSTRLGSYAMQFHDGLGHRLGSKELGMEVTDSTVAVAVATGTSGVPINRSLSGMSIVSVTAAVHTKGITGSTTLQLRRRRAGSNSNVLSTALSLGDVFFATTTAISASFDDLLEGDLLYVDVSAVHTTPPLGLSVAIEVRAVVP